MCHPAERVIARRLLSADQSPNARAKRRAGRIACDTAHPGNQLLGDLWEVELVHLHRLCLALLQPAAQYLSAYSTRPPTWTASHNWLPPYKTLYTQGSVPFLPELGRLAQSNISRQRHFLADWIRIQRDSWWFFWFWPQVEAEGSLGFQLSDLLQTIFQSQTMIGSVGIFLSSASNKSLVFDSSWLVEFLLAQWPSFYLSYMQEFPYRRQVSHPSQLLLRSHGLVVITNKIPSINNCNPNLKPASYPVSADGLNTQISTTAIVCL